MTRRWLRILLFVMFVATLPLPYFNAMAKGGVLTGLAMFLLGLTRSAPGEWGTAITLAQVGAYSIVMLALSHFTIAAISRFEDRRLQALLLGGVGVGCCVLAAQPIYVVPGTTDGVSVYGITAVMTLFFLLSIGRM